MSIVGDCYGVGMNRAVMLIAVLCAILGGCAAQPDPVPVRIGAPADPQMQMLAAVYRGALRAQGMAVAQPIVVAGERALLDSLSADDLDLFGSTVPALLTTVLPAGRIAGETASAAPTEFGDGAYTLLSRSLPSGVVLGDPLSAGASESGGQPVPVYRAVRFGRADVKALNKVAGELTPADLADMTRRWQSGQDRVALVDEWLGRHGLV